MGNYITVIGVWEPGFTDYEQIIEWRMWKQTLAAYGVNRWIMSGPKPNGGAFEYAKNLDEALEMADGEIVLLEPWNGIPLKEFSHPEKAVYVFGNALLGLEKYRDSAISVNIPTPNPTDMFAAACLPTVLNDRYEKL